MKRRYKSHNTKERLAELDNKKLVTLVTDKDQRKSVVNALKGYQAARSVWSRITMYDG